MNILKFLLTIIFWLLVLILLYITFYINQQSFSNIIDLWDEYSSEAYSLSLSWTKVIESVLGDDIEWVFLNELNYTDSIYFSNKDSYLYIESYDWDLISLNKWIFVLDLNNITKKYKIVWTWFELEPLWWGLIYIDTTGVKTLIFSLSSTINLEFKDETWSKVYSNIYMFPHSHFKFDVNKNKKLGNADLFRVDSSISNWYFSEDIFYSDRFEQLLFENWYDSNNLEDILDLNDFEQLLFENWYDSNNLEDILDLDKLDVLLSVNWNIFFNTVKLHLKEKSNYFSSKYIKLTELIIYDFPWREYIEKYANIFINDNKKIVYYKNIIFNNLIRLLTSDEIEESIIEDIEFKMAELKRISSDDYEIMNDIINYYYRIISNHKFIDQITILDNYSLLITKLNWEKLNNEEFLKSYIYLRNLYAIYDFTDSDKYINIKFFSFINNFYENLEISNNQITFVDETNKILMESLLFFLEDYMKAHLFNSLNDDLKSYTDILNKYIILNRTIYFSSNNEISIRTGLNKNIELLKDISDFFRLYIFEKDRDEDGLLIPLIKNNFELSDLLALQKEKISLLDLFYNNKKYLENSKETELINIYKKYNGKIEEYFSALINIDIYIKEYSNANQGIKGYSTIWEDDNITYNKEGLKKYFSIFNDVDISKMNIYTIPNRDYFFIKDFIVKTIDNNSIIENNLSFTLFPEEYFRIEKIKINGNESNYSYELDKQKELLDMEYKWAKPEDKDKFDFRNFFTNTFFLEPSYIKPPVFTDTEVEVFDENKSIVIFKRDTLLWEKWEFSSLADMLEIEYKNLIVKSLEDITLSEVILNTQLDALKYKWIFTSRYFINSNAKDNYFYKRWWIILKIYSYNYGEVSWFMFWWRELKVIWKVYKKDFELTFNEISESYSKIDYILNLITSNFYNLWLIDIQYILKNKIVIFKFENNEKSINISLLWDNVVSVLVDWKEILTRQIKYNSLSDILWKIK